MIFFGYVCLNIKYFIDTQIVSVTYLTVSVLFFLQSSSICSSFAKSRSVLLSIGRSVSEAFHFMFCFVRVLDAVRNTAHRCK